MNRFIVCKIKLDNSLVNLKSVYIAHALKKMEDIRGSVNICEICDQKCWKHANMYTQPHMHTDTHTHTAFTWLQTQTQTRGICWPIHRETIHTRKDKHIFLVVLADTWRLVFDTVHGWEEGKRRGKRDRWLGWFGGGGSPSVPVWLCSNMAV